MPSFFPEGNTPLPQDREPRSLQKINSLLESIDNKTGGAGGGLTDAELRASPVPVSGTIGVSGTVPVSGTFWPATQPVSGTFWQATQPVSVASALSTRVAGWDIPVHDYRSFGYTSGNLTSITYKTGGAGGTTVATLTLAYDGSGNLTSITKS